MTNKPMLSVDLLPCPMCAGRVREPAARPIGHGDVCFVVSCNCGLSFDGGQDVESAVRTWNRRAKPAAPHQGEPVAYRWRVVGYREWTFSDCSVEFDARSNDDRFEAQALYAEQPAPAAVAHTMRSVMEITQEASQFYVLGTSNWCGHIANRLNGVKP